MGCSDDRKKAFLTQAESRIKNKLEEDQNTALSAANNLVSKTKFVAVVLSLPRENQAELIVSTNTGKYGGVVRVRIQELDRAVPDPGNSKFNSIQTVKLIEMHQKALIQSGVPSLKLGDRVWVEFTQAPVPSGKRDTPVIIEFIESDDAYAKRLRTRFANSDSSLSNMFVNGNPSTNEQREREKYPPRKGTFIGHGGTPVEITNGEIPNSLTVQCIETNELKYRGSENKDNYFRIAKHPNNNYADKLQELAVAYYAEFSRPLWITSMMRSYDKQMELHLNPRYKAADPGTSNHGWGLAFDWHHKGTAGSGFVQKTDAEFKWMKKNASTYGFWWAGVGFGEPWHFEIAESEVSKIYSKIDK